MKKSTFLSGIVIVSGLFASSHKASAQITITKADLPSAGLIVGTEEDSTSLPTYGSPSASSQYWDFSGLKKQQAHTIAFMDPSATKYASKFPLANLADSVYGGNGYEYIASNASYFSGVGAEEIQTTSGTTFQIEINLNPLFEQSPLPATYGTIVPPSVSTGSETFTKTFSVVVTAEKFTANIQYSDTADAWGTMKMPNGYTYNVIRAKHHEVDNDSVYLKEFGS